MAEFRHFCNVLERSDENKWCQKRHRILAIFHCILKGLDNSAYPKSPQKARKYRLMHWFDAFFRTRNPFTP